MSVLIHGKKYITVSERVEEAGKDFISLDTQVLQFDPIVVVKAIVTTQKGIFSGISAANPDKAIEKASPYEVAETSAVGRALGFAGYGIVEGIATADEMVKADTGVTSYPASEKQKDYIVKLEEQKGLEERMDMEGLTKDQAGKRIEELIKMPAGILNEVNASFARSEEEMTEETDPANF